VVKLAQMERLSTQFLIQSQQAAEIRQQEAVLREFPEDSLDW